MAAHVNAHLIPVLVAHGADVNCRRFRGRTLLHDAVFRNDDVAVGFLLAAGIDTTMRDDKGIEAVRLFDCRAKCGKLIENHRRASERAAVVELAVGLKALDLPVLVLSELYGKLIAFDDERVPLHVCWDILKKTKAT